MRYSRLAIALLAFLVFVCPVPTFAGTVSLDLVGVGSNSGGGVYAYPYYFLIGTSTQQTPLICDSFDNRVQPPETWTANVYNLLTAGSAGEGFYAGMQSQYDEAGLIYEAILTGAVNVVEGNWAIWGLFSSTARGNSFYTTAGPNNTASPSSIASAYLTILDGYGSHLPSFLNNMVVYTPVGGNPSNGPQEYIGVVPEPGTLALFGSGLAFLGGFLRKRLAGTQS
jgi:PEP-CTERM motif